jgi:hypothetical protein
MKFSRSSRYTKKKVRVKKGKQKGKLVTRYVLKASAKKKKK